MKLETDLESLRKRRLMRSTILTVSWIIAGLILTTLTVFSAIPPLFNVNLTGFESTPYLNAFLSLVITLGFYIFVVFSLGSLCIIFSNRRWEELKKMYCNNCGTLFITKGMVFGPNAAGEPKANYLYECPNCDSNTFKIT